MLEEGKIVKLSDDKEYIIINRVNLHNINYLFLITNSKPIEMVIVTEKNIDGEVVLEEIKDNDELDYVLSQFALSKELEEEID